MSVTEVHYQVSVLIPVSNAAEFLPDAIESALNQDEPEVDSSG
jgi:glycosyltransferase involved in cell wall biosynthesis